MEAFLMHWRKLRSVKRAGGAGALSPAEDDLLQSMEGTIAVLDPVERSALGLENPESAAGTGSIPDHSLARRRQRAELKLLPTLIAAGWVQS
jgi:hypothetical protein